MVKKLTKKQKAELKKKKAIAAQSVPPVPETPASPTPPPESPVSPGVSGEGDKSVTCNRCKKTYLKSQTLVIEQQDCCPYCGSPAEWKR